MDLIACGYWLEYPLWKRILLAIRYWLLWFLIACWKSKYYYWRYLLWKILRLKPLTWGDLTENPTADEFKHIVNPDTVFHLSLSGKGHFVWYESKKQLEEAIDIKYPVDWEGKGIGWYPFW